MKIKLLGFIFLIICIVFGILRFMPERPVKTPPIQTVFLIGSILDDFDALDDSEQHQFVLTLETTDDSVMINRKLTTLLTSKTNNLRQLDNFDLSNGLFRDAWGTPLLFALTNSATYGHLNPLIKGRPRPFVIWSSGSNHTNELGYGDDVFTGQ